MEFRMLGPFEAWRDGEPVDLGDLQQRYILAVLLLHLGKPVSTESLIETIWGASRPRTNLVPGYVAKIRKLLRDDASVTLETTPTGYVLRMPEAERLDTVQFSRLREQAGQARTAGDTTEAARLLHEAVGLWRGRFLEDLDIERVGGSAALSFNDAWMDALGDLAEMELATGNHRWVRDKLRPVVRDDPSRQRLVVLLMRALLASGDRVEAMKAYHRTRDALDEYGMETATDLRQLAGLAQQGELRSTLPPRPARFVGRDEELSTIESLADGGSGVVWLTGSPGVGKTALALEAAHRLRGRFGDARLFIALQGFTPNLEPTPPAEALARLLLDLGVPSEQIPPTLAGRMELYQSILAGGRTLIVLDDAASAAQVRPLLPESPKCLAIVTSRNAGEPDVGDNLRLGPLSAWQSAELFRRLVGVERLRGRSTQVGEVVARCGHLPLQIRVVASQFRRHTMWPLDHLLDLLTQAAPWSAGGEFDDAGIAACMQSYEQLDDEQKALFRLFGQVPGEDLGVPGAAALLGSDLATARALLDKLHGVSLLEEAVPERYHMLGPLKEFVTATLRPAGPRDALERLLDFYLVTTANAIAAAFPFERDRQPDIHRNSPVALTFDAHQAALAWLSVERPNLVAAIRYAAHGLPDHAWRLAVLLWRYLNTAGQVDDWVETLELAKCIVTADPSNRHGQGHVLLGLSLAHWQAGRLPQALELAARALPHWVQLGDVRGEANTLTAIALPTMELGDHDRAIAHLQHALAKYEAIGDQHGQANALRLLGHLTALHGDLSLAQRQHLAAVRLLRESGHTLGLARVLDSLGAVQRRLGLLDEALANHTEAHALAVEAGDRSTEASALSNIGNVHRIRGRLDEAIRTHDQAIAVADQASNAILSTQTHLDRGATLRARGDQPAALHEFQTALELASKTAERGGRAHANYHIAQILHAIGEHERARGHWHAAEIEFDNLHQPEADEIRRERNTLNCACAPSKSSDTTRHAEMPPRASGGVGSLTDQIGAQSQLGVADP